MSRLKKYENATRKYLKMFGLTSWRVNFEWNPSDVNSEGSVFYCREDRNATFTLSRDVKLPDKVIDMIGFHEVLHVLLADLVSMAETTYSERAVSIAEHSIIVSLENFLTEEIKK